MLSAAAIALSVSVASCSDDDAPASPDKPTTSNPSKMSEVNQWIYSYMDQNYLWNEPISELTLNGNASYDKFLESILKGVDALDNLNRDDGHWSNGKRQYFYSYIERSSATASRAFDETDTGSGITYLSATYAPGSTSEVWLLPAIVVPGSPADKAGIKRGDAISKVNGTTITTSNYQTLAEKLKNGDVTVTHLTLNFNSSGSITGYDATDNLQIDKVEFEDPAIYKSTLLTLSSGKKVGYLLYMYFDMDYDNKLIDIFKQFKEQGATDLILDLRYNGGGHVLASTLLATLVSGNNHKGEIYNRTTYNAARTAKGEVGEYKFATASTPEGTYQNIATAAAAGLGLDNVYVLCSESTASASELIINGLRGVSTTVNLIGTTTNGKNVGMEAIQKTIGSYKYTLAPITFYSQNAKNFRDFADGFTPDYEIDEDSYLYGNFGTQSDPLCDIAFRWIDTGSKPAPPTASRSFNSISRLTIDGQRSPAKITGAIALPGRID